MKLVVFVSVTVELQRVLNLTDPKLRAKLGVSAIRIKQEPWRKRRDEGKEALTQAIGRIARQAGFEGILAPSAPGPGQNLAIFPDQLLRGSKLEVQNVGKLPKRKR